MEKKGKLYIVMVLIVVAVLAISYVGLADSSGDDQIRIGGVFHLTGPGSFWGSGELNAVNMAIDEINAEGGVNGKEMVLIVEDTQTDFPETVSSIIKLVEIDGVEIIIGPTWFGQVASPLAGQYEVLILSPSTGTVPQPNEYFFNVWPTERQEVAPTVAHMEKNNVKEVVIVYSLNDWSQSMRDNFVDEASKNNIKIIKEFETSPDENDFKTIIAKIKLLNPDAVYSPFAFFPSQGSFSKQTSELGLDIQLYSSSGTENPVLLETFGEIENTIYPYPKITSNEDEFRERYMEKYGLPASPSSAYAYDSVYLLEEALESGAITPKEIGDYLRAISFDGVSNQIDFDENGRIQDKPHIMKMVRNGEFVLYG